METVYCGPPPVPEQLATSFNTDPVLLAGLLGLAVVFRRNPYGLGAVATLAIAFVSPLCSLTSALFSARVVHHLLLIGVAAPLLAMALPPRASGGLALSFVFSAVVLWAWHIPAAYDAAYSNIAIYGLMQVSLLGSAILFWRAVLAQTDSPVEQLVYVVAAFAQMGVLGALLTFASTSLYESHAYGTLAWGLTPLEDQSLGGLIMWVPGGIPYAVAAALIARKGWMRLKGVAA